MSKYLRKNNRVSDKTQEEAFDLATEVLKPSQIKEYRKVVAQGIQQGIDLYKKKNKEKVRELDKQLKKVANTKPIESEVLVEKIQLKQHWLPWLLLLLSWLGFIAFYFKGSL